MMKKAALIVYNIWCIFWFIGIFLVLFPFMWVFIQRKAWYPYGHRVFQLWADLFFPIIGKPLKVIYRYKPNKKGTYVFVSNHFSYLDIAVGMGIVKNYFSFVGKSSVSKIPLLGYGFRKLHIAVDRSDKDSRSKTLMRGVKALAQGKSIYIMPEGGIISKNIPQMHQPFKDGPFIMAIENQVPIVPITLRNLYKIMPQTLIHWGRPEVVFHEPIHTKGLDKYAVEDLKQLVYSVIQEELNKTPSS